MRYPSSSVLLSKGKGRTFFARSPSAASLLALLCWLCTTGSYAQNAPNPPQTSSFRAAPVYFAGQKLFSVYATQGTYQPDERAQIIAGRIERFAANPQLLLEGVHIAETGKQAQVLADEAVLVTFMEEDGLAAGRSARSLATDSLPAIKQAVMKYRQENSFSSLTRSGLIALLATALFLVTLWLLNLLQRRLSRRIEAQRGKVRELHRIDQLDSFLAGNFTDALLQLLGFLRLAATLALTYGWLIFVLSLFSQTRTYARLFSAHLRGNLRTILQAFLERLPDLILIGLIALLTFITLRLLKFFFEGVGRGALKVQGLDSELARPTFRIVRFLVLALAAIAIYPYIPGSGSLAFQGLSVFFGALFTLGSTSFLSNLIAGVVLTFSRAYRIGDRVKIGETVGDILDRSDTMTRIRTVKNEQVLIPNGLVLATPIINYSTEARRSGLILYTGITIGYDAPWRQVHKLLIAAAKATDGILEEPAPFVLQTALNDFNVSYQINAYTARPNEMANLYSELHKNIQEQFNEAGLEIMSPHYTSLRDGNPIAIPDSYIPPDSPERAFRVRQEPPV